MTTITPSAMGKTAKETSVIQEVVKENVQAISVLKPGDVVQGTLIDKGSKLIIIDLGRNGTGAVYGGELQNAREMVRGLRAGDKIAAKVIDPDNEDGFVELSISEAGRQKAWDEILELKEKDEVMTLRASGFNKGGLIIELCGIKGFLPLSQLSTEHYPKIPDGDKNKIVQELQQLSKEDLKLKIIDVNTKTGKLIFSERAANEESLKELAQNYEVGQEIQGVISGVASFGAFIRFTDNPSVEGLIHISELDHRLIDNPKEIVNVDDAVKAKIIEIKDGKIYLSLKALKEDPWKNADKKYKEGVDVKGTVYVFNPFGAIIDLGNGLQGQIHVTEFGGIDEMRKALQLKQAYDFVIAAIKPEEKRIYLKLKQV